MPAVPHPPPQSRAFRLINRGAPFLIHASIKPSLPPARSIRVKYRPSPLQERASTLPHLQHGLPVIFHLNLLLPVTLNASHLTGRCPTFSSRCKHTNLYPSSQPTLRPTPAPGAPSGARHSLARLSARPALCPEGGESPDLTILASA